MEEWQELAQSVFIALIFAFLVAKLISVVLHFKEDHLKIVRRGDDLPKDPPASESEKGAAFSTPEASSEEEEWEGVESTELDEAFSAATAFVAATAADGKGKVGSEVQLQLYGLYKIATEGPCTTTQPNALKMTARALVASGIPSSVISVTLGIQFLDDSGLFGRNAWHKLGAMPPEEAMEKYIGIVSELYPTWTADSLSTRNLDETGQTSGSSAKGPMGPVFSSFVYAEEPGDDSKLDAIHASAREGEADELVKFLDDGVQVDLKDGEGRTPLHWAVDRGHPHMVELLVNRKADVNAKDNEGQTPLHYAALCERREIAELLVKHGAALDAKDNDGNSANDICESAWDFMTPAN